MMLFYKSVCTQPPLNRMMVSKFHLKTLWSKAKISRKHLKNNLFLFLPMVVSYLLFIYQVSWKDFTTITRWCVTCSFEIWLLPSSFNICIVASGRRYIFYYKVYSLYCSKCTAFLTYLSLNITTIIFQWWCRNCLIYQQQKLHFLLMIS